VAEVEVEPPRVRVTGARREVLRLNEAVTEAIDVTGAEAAVEREVRVNLGGENVWLEEPTTVRVRVQIEPVEEG
jgi:YbbR domain-containing protein